jgi:RimJ/RimL family protein N-acetyltransferase
VKDENDPRRSGVLMTAFPRIGTARLTLRAFEPADAAAVQRLAGAPEVADFTLLPHPYADGMAEAWIVACRTAQARVEQVAFAIERVSDAAFVGAIGLALDPCRPSAKFGYWVGTPYWGRGYATEAASAVVAFGFETLGLERIWAPRFRANAASARVLEKVGFVHEGSRRRFVVERSRAETIEQHGCLRWEYFARVAQCGFGTAPSAAAVRAESGS